MRFSCFIRLCSFLLLVTVGSECSYASAMKCFVLQPPGQVLDGVTKIAILNFKGSYGPTVTELYVQPTVFPDYLTQALIDNARADELANAIAPRFVEKRIDLRDIVGKQYRDLRKRAREDVENGKLDEAYAVYASIIRDDPYNDAVMFNMGTLNEVVGNYDDAQEYYQKALSVRPDADYSKALDHCKRMKESSQSLIQSGVSIEKHTVKP